MIGLLAVVTGSPLSGEQLLLIGGAIAVVLIVLALLAEIATIRDELHRLRRANRRRDVLRVIGARRWR